LNNLNCSNNNLTIIPEIGRKSLRLSSLNCSNNKIFKLPTINLTQKSHMHYNYVYNIDCSYNNLTQLPDIVFNFIYRGNICDVYGEYGSISGPLINCSHNKIQSISNLPTCIRRLDCSNNYITELPEFSNMKILDISNNPITKKIIIPNCCQKLTISKDQIELLPENYDEKIITIVDTIEKYIPSVIEANLLDLYI
jgi:Leucine-rich repeat (LRR) protein